MAADIAMIGLGVMGRNLALNLAQRGRAVAVFDRDAARLQALAGASGIVACAAPAAVIDALAPPRAVMLMVPAGAAVDEAIAGLQPPLGPRGILIDGGHSPFRGTIRRARGPAPHRVADLGPGISGGE